MNTDSPLAPLLVVRGAALAIDFYVRALGAAVVARYEHGPDRRVSHADLVVAGAPFSVTEELRAWNSDAPPSLGGSPVVMQLRVAGAASLVRSMCDAGAEVVFPLAEVLGERMARVRDPFGHLWIVRQEIEALSVAEIQRRRDELFAHFAGAGARPAAEDGERVTEEAGAAQRARRRPRAHLVVGPVGAGKSTFATRLARERGALRLTLDDWMAALFSADRPEAGVIAWYRERVARCLQQIWRVAAAAFGAGSDVVLEIGLLARREREGWYRRLAEAGVDLTVYVLDAPRDVRRERVERRNHARGATFSMVVPPDIFELASDLWEPPEPGECALRDVRFVEVELAP